jgi:hypothetical protein
MTQQQEAFVSTINNLAAVSHQACYLRNISCSTGKLRAVMCSRCMCDNPTMLPA